MYNSSLLEGITFLCCCNGMYSKQFFIRHTSKYITGRESSGLVQCRLRFSPYTVGFQFSELSTSESLTIQIDFRKKNLDRNVLRRDA